MPEIRQKFRFLLLLICLVALMSSLPMLTNNDLLIDLVRTIYSASLFITIYVLAENKKLLLLGFALALPNFITNIDFFELSSNHTAINLRLLSSLSVDIFVVAFLLHYIFKTQQITINILYAACCVYLLLGLTWSICFTFLEFNFPGSFYGIKDISEIHNNYNLDNVIAYYSTSFLYYSYITLTTLGYGNIYPLTTGGNALAATEAIAGQLYLTILIGRLIGMHIAQTRK